MKRALYQSLYRMLNLREGENPDDIRIILCAYMGTAAFNIGGNTICSAFHKKIYQIDQRMSADQLNAFRKKYKHLKVVIIDEISTVQELIVGDAGGSRMFRQSLVPVLQTSGQDNDKMYKYAKVHQNSQCCSRVMSIFTN